MSVRPPIAIGIGCRRGASPESIRSLVVQTLAAWPAGVPCPDGAERRLFTIEDKRDESGMRAAAETLAMELVFLPRKDLRDAAPRVRARSSRALARFGVPSVAEAAALAGAGERASLIVPRSIGDGVTCAIAADLESTR